MRPFLCGAGAGGWGCCGLFCGLCFGGLGASGAFAQTATPSDQIFFSGDPPASSAKEPQIDCSYLPDEVRSQAETQGACDTKGGIVPNGPVVTARMSLDCTNMTDEARAEANKQGYCANGEIQPNNTVFGNCGWSWIYGSDAGRGAAHLRWGFLSIQGTVVRRNLGISWFRYPWTWFYNDSNWMFSSFYQKTRDVWAVGGYVFASLSGNVRLAWGGTCVILYPTSSFYVSY